MNTNYLRGELGRRAREASAAAEQARRQGVPGEKPQAFQMGRRNAFEDAAELVRIEGERERCEGYSNYPTFSVGVIMHNEREQVDYWRRQAAWLLTEEGQEAHRSRLGTEGDTPRELAQRALAEQIKEETERAAPELDGCFSSLLAHGLSAVDWHELAGEWLDELAEDARAAELDDEDAEELDAGPEAWTR